MLLIQAAALPFYLLSSSAFRCHVMQIAYMCDVIYTYKLLNKDESIRYIQSFIFLALTKRTGILVI